MAATAGRSAVPIGMMTIPDETLASPLDRHDVRAESSIPWWVVPIVLLFLSTAIALLRLRTFDEPFERDITTYLLNGQALNGGGQVYVDAFEIKPPGIFVAYALAEWAAGFGELEVYVLSVVAAVITLFGVYVAGATAGRNAGLAAAAFWVLLCSAPSLQANQPNTEVFINACVVWALALLVRAGDSSRGASLAIAVGVLFAIGSTFKQLVIVDAALLCCAHVAFAAGLPGGRRRAVRDALLIAAIGAATWLAMFGYFAATGRFEIFWVISFSNARAYAGNPVFNLFRYVREARFFPRLLWFTAPIAGLVVLGALRDRRSLLERRWGLYLTALVALQIKIPLNGPGFLPHYYQYWLPMLAIGAGWAVGSKARQPSPIPAWAMPAVGAAVAAFLLIQQGSYFFLPADEWSRLKYGDSTLKERALGRAIGNVLRPEEQLYQHGSLPGLYYYSGHHPPSLLLWTMQLNDTWPAARLLLRQHLASIKKNPPDLVVVVNRDELGPTPKGPMGLMERLLGGRPTVFDEGRNAQMALDPLLPECRAVKIETLRDFPDAQCYVRRGSPLDKRLGSAERRPSRREQIPVLQ
jgi:Dolichyl-phosphate-mannose-protein mannosyltransferase